MISETNRPLTHVLRTQTKAFFLRIPAIADVQTYYA